MRPRREPSSPAATDSAPDAAADPAPSRRRRLAGLVAGLHWPRRRDLFAAAVGAGGALVALNLLAVVWPAGDRAYQAPPEATVENLGVKPQRPITLLLVGVDSERLDAASNGAAPAGPANADALLLLRVQPRGPLQVLNLPTELAVRVPGEKRPQALGSLYGKGGVALTADAVRELTGLSLPAPDRYLVLPRQALRQFINGIGGLEIDPPRSITYVDKSQKLKIHLEAGLQRLGGAGVEQLLRYRDQDLGNADRRQTHERFEASLRDRLRQSEPLTALPIVLRDLKDKVQTNLTASEALSLLAAGLDDRRPISFSRLPLDPPKPSSRELRQLSQQAPRPLWPEPRP